MMRLLALHLFALLLLAACQPVQDTPSAQATDAAALPVEEEARALTDDPVALGEAPDFTLQTLSGDSLRLADLRGKVVLINFWATWCGPCIEEIPELIALYDELESEGLVILGISLDEEGAEIVRPFAEAQEIDYPILLDDGAVANRFGGVWALPTTYVIDQNGQIIRRIIGLYPVAEERPVLQAMLKGSGRTG